MKRFPKSFSLNIFGKKIPVKVIKNLKSDQSVHGLYSTFKKIILIAEDQTKDEAIMTLIHEIVHGIFDRAGLNQAISHELEEIIAEQISVVINENFILNFKK